MTEQEENEFICRKLLGWGGGPILWSDGRQHQSMPSFTTWAEAGLILGALQSAWPRSRDVLRGLGGSLVLGVLSPNDARIVALEYIRSLP